MSNVRSHYSHWLAVRSSLPVTVAGAESVHVLVPIPDVTLVLAGMPEHVLTPFSEHVTQA
jgi:hypothetical protein